MVPSAFRTVSLRWKKLYPCSLVFRISNSSKPERSLDKKTPSITVLPVLSGGYNSLIDSAKQKNGLEKGDQFALALNEFLVREKYRRGHVAFIRIAMQRMDEFGLEKDLVTYNRILDIFPRGRFAPKSMIDAFWPRSTPQLELCLELLTKMEENGIRPSFETYDIVEVVFGRYSLPHEKCIRMMFLFDKYRDIDPYEIRSELPTDPVELSRLALFRMIGKDGQLMEIKVSGDCSDGYILAGNSEKQLKLLENLGEKDFFDDTFLHVEGPRRLWLKKMKQHYFSLRISESKCPASSASSDTEDDGLIFVLFLFGVCIIIYTGVVLGLCMCSPFSRESLQEWIGMLQQRYPSLSRATIIYDINEQEEINQQDSDQPEPFRT